MLLDNSVDMGDRMMTIQVDPLLPKVLNGDRKILKDALSKLVDNAVKFTPSDGRVCLLGAFGDSSSSSVFPSFEATSTVMAAIIRFTVLDSGPGIPPNLLPTVLEPFVQGEDGATRRCVPRHATGAEQGVWGVIGSQSCTNTTH